MLASKWSNQRRDHLLSLSTLSSINFFTLLLHVAVLLSTWNMIISFCVFFLSSSLSVRTFVTFQFGDSFRDKHIDLSLLQPACASKLARLMLIRCSFDSLSPLSLFAISLPFIVSLFIQSFPPRSRTSSFGWLIK